MFTPAVYVPQRASQRRSRVWNRASKFGSCLWSETVIISEVPQEGSLFINSHLYTLQRNDAHWSVRGWYLFIKLAQILMATSVNVDSVVWFCVYQRQSRESDRNEERAIRVFATSCAVCFSQYNRKPVRYCICDKGAISMWFTSKYNSQQLVVFFF